VKVIILDNDGNVRMERDPMRPALPPPPGWDHAKWTAKVVEDAIRQIAREEA
jgi:hypothetical protein